MSQKLKKKGAARRKPQRKLTPKPAAAQRKLTPKPITTQYDDVAKTILSIPIILATLLKYCVPELAKFPVQEIVAAIREDSPRPGKMHIRPTNIELIRAGNKSIRMDLCYIIVLPNSTKIRAIVNLEAQKKRNPGYVLPKRAMYTVAFLLSDQKGKTFENSEFDDIVPTYSIWVCFNPYVGERNTSQYFHMTQESLDYIISRSPEEITEEEIRELLKPAYITFGDRDMWHSEFMIPLFDKLIKDAEGLAQLEHDSDEYNTMLKQLVDGLDDGRKNEEIFQNQWSAELERRQPKVSVPQADYNLMTVIMLYLGNAAETEVGLLQVLDALFKMAPGKEQRKVLANNDIILDRKEESKLKRMMNLGEQLREETHEEDGLNYVRAAMQDGDSMPQILKVMRQLRFSDEQAEDLIARVRAEQTTASA